MRYDALIHPDIEIGDPVNTGGIYYGPYNKVTSIGKSPKRIAIHVKGHNQYWGQNKHYIPAHVIVFEVVKINERGSWECKNIWEKECGRQSRKVQAEAIVLLMEPNPGTQEAIDAGCTCPVLDNNHGWGYLGMGGGKGIFCYNGGCPLHWMEEENDAEV